VPRFRRRMRSIMRAPIVSFKHQHSQITSYVGGNANGDFVINVGSSQAVPVSPNTTPLGNKQYSVDLSVSFTSGSASAASDFSWMLVHFRADQNLIDLFAGQQASNWSIIGLSQAKNQVIESHMGTIGTEDGASYRFDRHIKLPKIWHRVREGDQLVLSWSSTQAGTLALGARFKTYS